ncbi:MAG: hypothetical protein RL033_7838 [Pseudomonadota bacterium]|jgi:hypothetical protein
MRSFLTYGLISLVGVASLYACSDDSGDGGSGGNGGTGNGGTAGAGQGGTAGNSSMAGNGGGGASSVGGSGGAGPVAVAPASNCAGCVQLSVLIPATPVATTGSQAGYIFSAAPTAAPFDLSAVSTITWRVQALTTDATYFVQPFLQNAPPESPDYLGSYPALVPLTAAAFAAGAWVDVVVDVAAIGAPAGGDAGVDAGPAAPVVADAGDAGAAPLTAFDKSKVRTIGLNVGAGATGTPGFVSVEIDSVTVVGTSNFTTKNFATDTELLGLNMYMVPPGTLPPSFH